ncbi:lipocalin family protein [Polaribacter sp. SA4-12]|uniref:lipocalin family protein n=1 Tax=Polaribacter sp. SA4-12 TaxID=1312072 RepID=UPI000B3C9ED5|nr:lipocalin family protein [Polaribacter sp. SA4-12]ARV14495.1 hypothetical protein BTO07_04730 [Polaribacter sp. SA4-12]
MKKKILLLLTVITFLTACESNDNLDINITNADLIGTWNATEQTMELASSFTINGVTITSNSSGYGKDFDFIYTFAENPNIVAATGSYTSVTTTTSSIPGQQDIDQEIELNSIEGFDSGIWSLDGNSITISDSSGQSNTAEIVEFTGSKLKLKIAIDESQNISGINADISGEIFLTLEK